MLTLVPPSMSMCLIGIPSRCPQMKRGFMCAPGFSGFSNTARSAPSANSATPSIGAQNYARIVKTMLRSIGTSSSPCRSLSLPELWLPSSGWQFPDSGLQLPESGFSSSDLVLPSPLVRVPCSPPHRCYSLPPWITAFPATFALSWSWAINS
jgi:hypothetical protein